MLRFRLAALSIVLVMLSAAAVAAPQWKVVDTFDAHLPWQEEQVDVSRLGSVPNSLRIEVQGSDIEIGDIHVFYKNGPTDTVAYRDVVSDGSTSRTIVLKRRPNTMASISVAYRAMGDATVKIMVDAPPVLVWDELGCKKVAFGSDFDTVNVSSDPGTISSVKFLVSNSPVEFVDVTVVYDNGKEERLKVRAIIKAGGESRPFDLAGKQFGIDRVEMIYRGNLNIPNRPRVCVQGLTLQ